MVNDFLNKIKGYMEIQINRKHYNTFNQNEFSYICIFFHNVLSVVARRNFFSFNIQF